MSQLSTLDTGQPAFASLAIRSNSSRSMPSTWPVSVRSDRVMVNPSPSFSSVTFALVSRLPCVLPAPASAKASAIVKQPAWAAAISSSGLVPGPSSNRVLKPYWASVSRPDWVEIWPLPSLPRPSYRADALRVVIYVSSCFTRPYAERAPQVAPQRPFRSNLSAA
ncbi:hypothetical protein WR25_01079 [Diploscapter pachys]|uniref:Uncharacterized protein n=1 Tax=Diploscapter pachys TaxID=2018661 RepID=A0A2A2KLY8_9BILA|nr:hypothetical protein WR25_01079 [Diploscapter pachys]